MVEVDLYILIGILVAVVTAIGVAIAYVVKLSMRVKHLEDELKNNPVFVALKQFETSTIIQTISEVISQRLERRNG